MSRSTARAVVCLLVLAVAASPSVNARYAGRQDSADVRPARRAPLLAARKAAQPAEAQSVVAEREGAHPAEEPEVTLLQLQESAKESTAVAAKVKYVPGTEVILQWALQAATMMVQFYSGYAVGAHFSKMDKFLKDGGRQMDAKRQAMASTIAKLETMFAKTRTDAGTALTFVNNIKLPALDPREPTFEDWFRTERAKERQGAAVNMADVDKRVVILDEVKALLEALSATPPAATAPNAAAPHPSPHSGPQSIAAAVDDADKRLADFVALHKELEDVSSMGAAWAKAEPTTKSSVKKTIQQKLYDNTIGQLRPKELLKQAVQTAAGFLLELTKSVLASYLGVLWAAIDLVNAIQDHRALMETCEVIARDYATMVKELSDDIEYSTCRGVVVVIEHKRKAFSVLHRLLGMTNSFLTTEDQRAMVEHVNKLQTEWDTMNTDVQATCSDFLNAPPPQYDYDLLSGNLGMRGFVEMSQLNGIRTINSWCYIPTGVAWLHCFSVTASQKAKLEDPNTFEAALLALLRSSPAVSVNLKLIEPLSRAVPPAPPAINEVEIRTAKQLRLAFSNKWRLDIHMKCANVEDLVKWANHIAHLQAVAHDSTTDSYLVLKGLGQANITQIYPHADVAAAPTFPFRAGAHDVYRALPVATQYRDSQYSVLSEKLTPEDPGWANTVHTKVLVSMYEEVPLEYGIAAVGDPGITSVILVPVGDDEHRTLKTLPVGDPFAGPVERHLYKFVRMFDEQLRDTATWSAQLTGPHAHWVPLEFLSEVPSTLKKVGNALASRTGLAPVSAPTASARPTVNFYLGTSDHPGVPISPISLCSAETMPTGWYPVPIFLENDKKTDKKCYETRLGSTKKGKKSVLCYSKDRRIFQAPLQRMMATEVDQIVDEVQARVILAEATLQIYQASFADKKAGKKAGEALPAQLTRIDSEGHLLRTTMFKITIQVLTYTNIPMNVGLFYWGNTEVAVQITTPRLCKSKCDLQNSAPSYIRSPTFTVSGPARQTQCVPGHFRPPMDMGFFLGTLLSPIPIHVIQPGFLGTTVVGEASLQLEPLLASLERGVFLTNGVVDVKKLWSQVGTQVTLNMELDRTRFPAAQYPQRMSLGLQLYIEKTT